jgi:hypothetical protein
MLATALERGQGLDDGGHLHLVVGGAELRTAAQLLFVRTG